MTTKTDELEHRVAAKRKDLESGLERIRADAARQGFDNITDKTADAINELLKSF